MADFRPLEGLEYDLDVAGDFGGLLSPPYDVIDADMRAELAQTSPYNVVRIILPEGARKYEEAGKLAREWVEKGILRRTPVCFHVIEQRFEAAGREVLRTAIAGHVRLAPWREGGVYPHELTMPRPKADRLSLYRAAKMQPGPIMSLFEDRSGAIAEIFEHAKSAPVYREADGPDGSYDRIWRIDDEETIAGLSSLFSEENLFIADGHHRYETALAYHDELAAVETLPEDHPANFILMCLIGFDDPGLVMLPTHRLLTLDDAAVFDTALEALGADYEVEKATSVSEVKDACGEVGSAVGLYASGRPYLLRMKEGARRAFEGEAGKLMPSLNVYEVRQKVLTRFFDDVETAISTDHVAYTHDFDDAIERVDSGNCQAAVILAPLDVRALASVALAGESMPPKSTYFHPKLPTGVVLKPLA